MNYFEFLNNWYLAQGLESRRCSGNGGVMTELELTLSINVIEFWVTHFVNSTVCKTHTHSHCSLFQHFLNPVVKYLRRTFLFGCWEHIRYSINTYWLVFYWLVIFQTSENSSSTLWPKETTMLIKCLIPSLPALLWVRLLYSDIRHFFFSSRDKSIFLISCPFQIPFCKSFFLFLSCTWIFSCSSGWNSSFVSYMPLFLCDSSVYFPSKWYIHLIWRKTSFVF